MKKVTCKSSGGRLALLKMCLLATPLLAGFERFAASNSKIIQIGL